jgi:hypothetical protein
MTDTDTFSAAAKQKRKRVGRMRVKKDKVVSVSFTAWHYSALTLLYYVGQRVRIQ